MFALTSPIISFPSASVTPDDVPLAENLQPQCNVIPSLNFARLSVKTHQTVISYTKTLHFRPEAKLAVLFIRLTPQVKDPLVKTSH
jgi:hypothetical protein